MLSLFQSTGQTCVRSPPGRRLLEIGRLLIGLEIDDTNQNSIQQTVSLRAELQAWRVGSVGCLLSCIHLVSTGGVKSLIMEGHSVDLAEFVVRSQFEKTK